MAKEEVAEKQKQEEELKKLASSYLGLSFSVLLTFLRPKFASLLPTLQNQVTELSAKLFQAEEQLREMKSRRREDSKANARAVEIFASHRNMWQAEERRLLQQIDAAAEEIIYLTTKVEELEKYEAESRTRMEDLQREVSEREEMITFMSRGASGGDFEAEDDGQQLQHQQLGGYGSREYCEGNVSRAWFQRNSEEYVVGTNGNLAEDNGVEDQGRLYQQEYCNGFSSEFTASASKFLIERTGLWQVCAANAIPPISVATVLFF